ncbi:hypothetical protein FHS29_000723 [Saccharothrix tamanrassetensis]|uniref:DUF397 domain-containing protein n=1 Tax=Saccharothrix tamanrassetensis TaxID=1051531 RepID=A0A841CB27_9PSEU|nr:DUF397 domain-containing protein [Saccharothrix tamanrassetensis]MBB5954153.1 hypothetical protein [Saccharothrix tamanrassetensis]
MTSEWRKSSRSQNGADNCVEVVSSPSRAAVRDSKNPDGPVLVFASAEFAGFLKHLKTT